VINIDWLINFNLLINFSGEIPTSIILEKQN